MKGILFYIPGIFFILMIPMSVWADPCLPCPVGRFDKVNCVIGKKADLKPLGLKLDTRYWYDARYGSFYRASQNKRCIEGRFDGVNCLVKSKRSLVRAGLNHFIEQSPFWFDPKYGAVYTAAQNCNDKAHQPGIFGYPFPKNKDFRVDNAFFGYGGHNQKYNVPHAVDFKMPVGTFIYAAKSGVVIKAVNHFKLGGDNELYGTKANEIVIDHKDGTYGVYLHFKYKGVAVKPGQKIKLGQYLGRSGATGWVTDPHLHFDVRIKGSQGYLNKSTPWKFRKPSGQTFTPTLGMVLKH